MAYFRGYIQIFAVADPDIPFRGAHEIRLNAKGTVRIFCFFFRGGGGGCEN